MKYLSTFSALALVAGAAVTAQAQTASQTVTFSVSAINRIAVAGSPTLAITDAVPGEAPTSVTATASYDFTSNQTAKISAKIDTDMPTGVTLSAQLAAPAGSGTSVKQPLSTTSVDLVSGIDRKNAKGVGITYSLDATSAAGVVSGSKTVTYTVTGA